MMPACGSQIKENPPMKKIWVGLLATFAYNTAIAGLLTVIGWTAPEYSHGFWRNFIFSQCIGFSIAIINSLTLGRMRPSKKRWAAFFVTMPTSIAAGLTLAFWLTGYGSWDHPYILQTVFIGLFFGILASITFVLFERIEQLDLEVKQRQLSQIESEKRQMEAQLKMLQAQIEPHFLFNTLANVGSLIDSDQALAKRLLERLNDWLRIALLRARSDQASLDDELDMLENYLQILKIRFGERLRWSIEVAEEARLATFPPMLLQPLVENAVRHGIEPKIGGGEIVIHAHIENATLRIAVSDNGVGMAGDTDAAGAGLDNVRARLAALFGDRGRLILQNNEQGGVTATLELPR